MVTLPAIPEIANNVIVFFNSPIKSKSIAVVIDF